MMKEQKIKILLVSGCPRSGTTMLNLLLNSHKNIAVTNEINLCKRVPKLIKILYKTNNSTKNRSYFRLKSARENWALDDLLKFIPSQSLSLNKVLFEWISSIKQNPKLIKYIGDKTPTYYRENIDELQKQLNCDIYIIHITRDPLEVISSIMRRYHNSKKALDYWSSITNIFDAIEEWIEAWQWRNKVKLQNSNFLDLNYNYAIKNIDELTEKISEFLNLDNQFDKSIVNTNPLEDLISKEKINSIDKQFFKVISVWNDKKFHTFELDKDIDQYLIKRNKKNIIYLLRKMRNKIKLLNNKIIKKFRSRFY